MDYKIQNCIDDIKIHKWGGKKEHWMNYVLRVALIVVSIM